MSEANQMLRESASLWVDLPMEIKKPTDIAKYRDTIRRIVQTQNDVTRLLDANTRTVTQTVSGLPASGSIVTTARNVNTAAPLAGGGALTSDLTLSIPAATTSANGYLTATDWTTFNNKLSSIPIASATVLGGVKVGSRLTINPSTGVLSADDQSYTLPTASATVLGGVKVGSRLTINPSTGVLSADDQNYTLPIASASVLGGIKVGSGLTIDAGTGVLSVSTSSGVAGETDSTYYIHEQTSASTQWQIRHDLGKVPTGLLVVVGGQVLEPAIEIGVAAVTAYYTHEQASAATTWTINHGLTAFPTGLRVKDGNGNVVEPAIEIDQTSPFQVRLYFDVATSGYAYVSTGGAGYPVTLTFSSAVAGKAYLSIGSFRAPYQHSQVTSAITWTVNHDLGRVPTAIRVFNGAGQLLEPDIDVLESDPYTLTLNHGQAETGTAWVN